MVAAPGLLVSVVSSSLQIVSHWNCTVVPRCPVDAEVLQRTGMCRIVLQMLVATIAAAVKMIGGKSVADLSRLLSWSPS
jgi:hypothetical protein